MGAKGVGRVGMLVVLLIVVVGVQTATASRVRRISREKMPGWSAWSRPHRASDRPPTARWSCSSTSTGRPDHSRPGRLTLRVVQRADSGLDRGDEDVQVHPERHPEHVSPRRLRPDSRDLPSGRTRRVTPDRKLEIGFGWMPGPTETDRPRDVRTEERTRAEPESGGRYHQFAGGVKRNIGGCASEGGSASMARFPGQAWGWATGLVKCNGISSGKYRSAVGGNSIRNPKSKIRNPC